LRGPGGGRRRDPLIVPEWESASEQDDGGHDDDVEEPFLDDFRFSLHRVNTHLKLLAALRVLASQ
jgi:hypothetical protein